MDLSPMNNERRHHKRYKAREGSFAVLMPKSKSSRMGAIIDVGRGGLSFYSIDTRGLMDMGTGADMDIFISGKGIFMGNVPFQIVSEKVIPKEIPFYSVVTRRFGIKFISMPEQKIARLQYFISNHTKRSSPPDVTA